MSKENTPSIIPESLIKLQNITDAKNIAEIQKIPGFSEYLLDEIENQFGSFQGVSDNSAYQGSLGLNFVTDQTHVLAGFILERHRWRSSGKGGIAYDIKFGAIKDKKVVENGFFRVRDMYDPKHDDFRKYYQRIQFISEDTDRAIFTFSSGGYIDTYKFDFVNNSCSLIKSQDRARATLEEEEKTEPFEQLSIQKQIKRIGKRLIVDSDDPRSSVYQCQLSNEQDWVWACDIDDKVGDSVEAASHILFLVDGSASHSYHYFGLYLYGKGQQKGTLISYESGNTKREISKLRRKYERFTKFKTDDDSNLSIEIGEALDKQIIQVSK